MKSRLPATLALLGTLLALSLPARADWITATIPVNSDPSAIAVNPATNKIYVSNNYSGTLQVIDGATNAAVTVPGFSNPQGIAVNPVTNRIFVANTNNTVTVIDGATNATASVPTGSSTYSISVNPATNKAYAVNGSSNTVTVIDGATLDTAIVAVGNSPRYAAINPVTNRIYVPNRSGNSVSVIDGADNSVVTVPVGGAPGQIVVNAATNKIYVTRYSNNCVTVIDGATNDTSSVVLSTGPGALAVNPATNKIYAACSYRVMVIDGATLDTVGIAASQYPSFISANPVTNKIYAAYSGAGASVMVIDGATNAASGISSGTMTPFLRAVAINPVTNKIYIAVDRNTGSSYNVTVIDGSSNTTATLAAGSSARAAAVNPVTNKAYVANEGGASLTVIDGATNGTTTLATGFGPWKVAVNPATNRIYVGNYNGNSLTVVNGATNGTTTLSAVASPGGIAVNPVTDRIYVTNYNSAQVTVIKGSDHTRFTVAAGANPRAIAVNPVTNKAYAANSGGSTVTVIDGADHSTATVTVGSAPGDVAVNPVTNKVYVSKYNGNSVTVIDGATNATATVTAGTNPAGLAVNPATNKIYVANSGSNNLTVINGADLTTVTVALGSYPAQVAVDPVADKIYVSNHLGSSLAVVDGATNSVTTLATGSGPYGLAVNPVTGKVYVPNNFAGTVTVIDPVPFRDSQVRAVLDTLPGNLAYQAQPAIAGKAVNRWSPDKTEMMGAVNRWMTGQEAWNWAAGPFDSAFSDSIGWSYQWGTDSLLYGENYLNLVPLEMQAAGTHNTGLGSALAGNMLTYPVYYLDSIPPSQVNLVSPADDGLTGDSAVAFVWHKAADNYSVGRYDLQIADNDSFSPVFRDTAVYDTAAVAALSSADSIYHWRVRAVDACGNIGPWSAVWKFELDVTSPAAPVLLTPADSFWQAYTTIYCSWTAVAKSAKASPVHYVLKAYRLPDTLNPVIEDTTSLTSDTLALTEGRYAWKVEAHDQALNQPGVSGLFRFGCDQTAPAVAVLISPANGLKTNQDSVTFAWHPGTDTLSGVKNYLLKYAYDSGFTQGLAETTLTDTSITLALADSNYYWKVETWDNVGNWSSWFSWGLTVDTQSPAAPALLTPADNTWLVSDTAFCSWSAAAKKTKASAVYYVLKGFLLPDTVNPAITDTTALTMDTLQVAEGRYMWRVEAHDLAGNPPGLSGFFAFGYDTTAPVLAAMLAPADSLVTNQSSVSFIWSVSSDAVSGLKEYTLQYACDPGFSAGLAETTLTDTSITLTLVDTNYYWRVAAGDTAGNSSLSGVRYLSIDTYDPAIPALASPADNIWLGDTAVVCSWNEVAKKIKASAVEYVIQLDTSNTFAQPLYQDTTGILLDSFNLAEGRYYWRVMAYDLAGNYGTYSGSRAFGVDTTVPDIQYVLDLPDDVSAPYGPYQVSSRVYDLSGVKSAWLFTQVNGGAWDSTAMFSAADSLYDSIPALSPAIDETLTVSYYVRAADQLDQTNTSAVYSFRAIDLSGVEGNPEAPVPTVFALNGAWPNPSRGHTTFKYQLPKESGVSLTVYNIAGQMVKRFDQGTKPAGYHQIIWNDNALPNGVYIYQLRAGNFSATRKLLMVR